jgi:hypothetical protein
MILYTYVCVCAFSLHRESPDRILGDKLLLFQGVGVCHICVSVWQSTLSQTVIALIEMMSNEFTCLF